MSQQPSLLPPSAGELLSAHRKAQGLTIEQAAARLLCQPTLIKTLEAGEVPSPAPIYVSGFLLRYLELLKFGEEERQQILDHFSDASETTVRSIFPESHRRPRQDRWMKVASYALAALLLGTFSWQLGHEWKGLDLAQMTFSEPLNSVLSDSDQAENEMASSGLDRDPAMDARNSGWTPSTLAETNNRLDALVATDGQYILTLEASADSWVEISGAGNRVLEQDLLRGRRAAHLQESRPFRDLGGTRFCGPHNLERFSH